MHNREKCTLQKKNKVQCIFRCFPTPVVLKIFSIKVWGESRVKSVFSRKLKGKVF